MTEMRRSSSGRPRVSAIAPGAPIATNFAFDLSVMTYQR
jgi:hypothetical protein